MCISNERHIRPVAPAFLQSFLFCCRCRRRRRRFLCGSRTFFCGSFLFAYRFFSIDVRTMIRHTNNNNGNNKNVKRHYDIMSCDKCNSYVRILYSRLGFELSRLPLPRKCRVLLGGGTPITYAFYYYYIFFPFYFCGKR